MKWHNTKIILEVWTKAKASHTTKIFKKYPAYSLNTNDIQHHVTNFIIADIMIVIYV
jgi:hypothetical protein